MNIRNPNPPDALVKRKRTSFVKPEKFTEEELQEIQNQKQAAHGAAVLKALRAKEAEARRERALLQRGQPQVRDEMAEAVNARMTPEEIPTKGNTDA
jgi:hypothetical protein